MSEKVIVALDAMGGDNAPVEIVKGAVEAVKEEAGLLVKLVGREEQVQNLQNTLIRRDRLKWLMHRTLLKPVSSRLWQSAGKKILPWYVR